MSRQSEVKRNFSLYHYILCNTNDDNRWHMHCCMLYSFLHNCPYSHRHRLYNYNGKNRNFEIQRPSQL